MADLPLERANRPLVHEDAKKNIPVTVENAPLLMVHFLNQIYGRLGYIIKLLEEKK